MRIVADRNIAYVSEAFGKLGEVVTLPSAELTRENVRDADLLLTRSTVKVNGALLDGSRVRFVATATIGIDHLDIAYLDGAKIAWASAPGSNADSVVQWMAAAARRIPDVARRRLGIVGVGNVGSRVERLWRALDVPPPLLCDPPRARATETVVAGATKTVAGSATETVAATEFVALEELLEKSDIVTLHVPLTRSGEDATVNLMNDARLALLPPCAWLINACRGEVLDGEALMARKIPALLDVFAGEPSPHARLVEYATLATPHIAGHSLDGKAAGTKMVYDAACAFLGVTPAWEPRDSLPPPFPSRVKIAGSGDEVDSVLAAVAAGYDGNDDDAALRAIVAGPESDRAKAFRRYRENYPERRELGRRTVALPLPRPGVIRMLNEYGVPVEPL